MPWGANGAVCGPTENALNLICLNQNIKHKLTEKTTILCFFTKCQPMVGIILRFFQRLNSQT